MFIFNVKFSGSKLFKAFFVLVSIIILFLFSVGIYKIFNKSNIVFSVSDKIKKDNVITMTSSNYTNILKTVHDDINSYVGMEIKCVGYVYKLVDFSDTQFVTARDMVISSDYQSVIVGFLCDYKDISKFEDGTWVEITGEITKGEYHGDIPILKIKELNEISKPTDEFVYPPDESYLPTSSLL